MNQCIGGALKTVTWGPYALVTQLFSGGGGFKLGHEVHITRILLKGSPHSTKLARASGVFG